MLRPDLRARRRLGLATGRPRLRRRGRLTLLVIGLGIGLGLGLGLLRARGWPAPAGPEALPGAPPVASGPVVDSPVPAEVLTRLPVTADALEHTSDLSNQLVSGVVADAAAGPRLLDVVPAPEGSGLHGPLRIEYSIDAELTRRVFRVLRRGRVRRGHAIVLDPRTGRVLAYASTDREGFRPEDRYPAASLVKVITAAAALEHAPDEARRPCRYRGSAYRLTRSRLEPPASGREISLEHALATSNNQCLARVAVHALGRERLLQALARFGWLEPPAPGHAAGSVDPGEDDYDLGRLGCGLAGCRITPLHAATLAASLAHGELLEPWWIDRVIDADGESLPLPARRRRRVMRADVAEELRSMLVRTTQRGTARSAFRDRRGRPRLGEIRVAGKTGNISAREPKGRFEWFAGVAPAERPSVAIAVVQMHDDLWWRKSSEIAADVLVEIFCERGRCRPELASRYTGWVGPLVGPVLLSEEEAAVSTR